MKKIGIALGALFANTAINAAEHTVILDNTQYGDMYAYTSHHSLNQIQNISLLPVTGLAANCTGGLFISDKDNRASFFILMSAISLGQSISLTYDTSTTGPWGDSRYCAIVMVNSNTPQ